MGIESGEGGGQRLTAYVAQALHYCAWPVHLRRTLKIALIVGTWLTLLNQGDAFWSEGWDGGILIKMALNYLTPFVVSNLGLLSNVPHPPSNEGSDARAGEEPVDVSGMNESVNRRDKYAEQEQSMR